MVSLDNRSSMIGRFVKIAAGVVAALCILMFLTEWYARRSTTFVQLAEPSGVLDALKVGGDLLTEYDSERGRRLLPNASVIVRNHYLSKLDVRIDTNSKGFRDAELPGDKTQGELRILALGDSVTISDYLPAEQSYVEQLQKNLNAKLPAGKIEVVNAGISDIGLSEEMGILRERGLSVRPDFVLLGFYLNDSLPPWGFAGKLAEPGILRRYSVAANSIYRAVKLREWIQGDYAKRFRWIREKEDLDWAKSREDFARLVELAKYDWGAAWNNESWLLVRNHFRKLRKLGEDHGFKVVVAALPVAFQVEADFVDDWPQQRLAEISRELGFLFFDPLSELRRSDTKKLYYDQCHYTPYGNALLGDLLADFFLRSALRPAGSGTTHG